MWYCTQCESCAEQGECGHRRHNVRLSSRCLPSHGYNTHSAPNLCSSTMHKVLLCKQHCLLSRSCRAARAVSLILCLLLSSLCTAPTHPPMHWVYGRPSKSDLRALQSAEWQHRVFPDSSLLSRVTYARATVPVLYTYAQAYNTRLMEVDCTTYPKVCGSC